MEFKIGNFSRLIKSFNVSSRAQGETDIRTQLTIDCADIDDDVEIITESIRQELKDNEITIYNGDAYYTFPDYDFNSVDKYVSESSGRLSITFVK